MRRPNVVPPSERDLARELGISRAFMWRAKQVASIPEEEFEALVESDNPPTVSELVAMAGSRASRSPTFTLPPDLLAAVDAWIAAQPDPKPSRSKAIRRLLAYGLGKP